VSLFTKQSVQTLNRTQKSGMQSSKITLRLELNSSCKRLAGESIFLGFSGQDRWWVPPSINCTYTSRPQNHPQTLHSLYLHSQTATVVLYFLFKGHFWWLMYLCNVDPHLHLLVTFPLPFPLLGTPSLSSSVYSSEDPYVC